MLLMLLQSESLAGSGTGTEISKNGLSRNLVNRASNASQACSNSASTPESASNPDKTVLVDPASSGQPHPHQLHLSVLRERLSHEPIHAPSQSPAKNDDIIHSLDCLRALVHPEIKNCVTKSIDHLTINLELTLSLVSPLNPATMEFENFEIQSRFFQQQRILLD